MADCTTGNHAFQSITAGANLYRVCRICGARSLRLAVARKIFGKDPVQQLWNRCRQEEPGGVPCPNCGNGTIADKLNGITIYLCPSCQSLEIPSHEQPNLPDGLKPNVVADPLAGLTEAEKQRHYAAMGEIAGLKHQPGPRNKPEAPWKFIPAMLGLPVLVKDYPTEKTPALTLLILVICGITYLVASKSTFQTYGLVPSQAFDSFGLRFITSFFLHAGIIHLVGNLYYLYTFGREIEDHLGRGRYVLLLILGSVLPDLFQTFWNGTSAVPVVGASAGISAVLAYYACQFPKRQITVALIFGFFSIRLYWLPTPVAAGFILWLALQLVGLIAEAEGVSNVAFSSHLLGAGVGYVLWKVWENGTPNK